MRLRVRGILGALMMGAGIAAAPSAHAMVTDPAIEGAKQCTQYFSRQERENGIPVYLLAAISSTESGRWHKGLGMSLPWPWTINVEGRGYYFATKQEAVDAVRKLRARGISSIDVGCMQVNLRHHPEAFASIEQAFDPAYNVAYAASFLRTNYDVAKSWRKAAADYHSKTPERGNPYVASVFNNWNTIINKVAAARGGSVSYTAEHFTLPKFSRAEDVTASASTPSAKPQRVASRKTFQAPRMHSIKVSDTRDSKREKGVLVIRPKYTEAPKQEQPKQLAAAQMADSVVDVSGSSKLISVSGSRTSSTSPRAAGPAFIFNN